MNTGTEKLSDTEVLSPSSPSLCEDVANVDSEVETLQNRYLKYGTVPTFYGARRSWLRKNKYESASINNRLETATTPEEIQSILDIGKSYKSASQGTIRSWDKLAQKRLRELNS